MNPFRFDAPARIVFGAGTTARLGEIAAERLGRRILFVTDPALRSTGLVEQALESLASAGVAVSVFAEVEVDPPERVVLAAAAMARRQRADGVVGFGGGSSLDTAKLAALLAPGRETLADVYGVGKARGPRLPLLLAPTTAGTGSEVTPIAIVTTATNEKMGVVTPVILPDVALLDPETTLGLPPAVTAATGIDAMVHAIEAHASASANNNPLSRALAREALRLMGAALERAVSCGGDRAARHDSPPAAGCRAGCGTWAFRPTPFQRSRTTRCGRRGCSSTIRGRSPTPTRSASTRPRGERPGPPRAHIAAQAGTSRKSTIAAIVPTSGTSTVVTRIGT